MKCEEFLDMIYDPSRSSDIESIPEAGSHLKTCKSCRAKKAMHDKISKGFATISNISPPPELVARVAGIPARSEPKPTVSWIIRIFTGFPLKPAAGIAFALILTMIFIRADLHIPLDNSETQPSERTIAKLEEKVYKSNGKDLEIAKREILASLPEKETRVPGKATEVVVTAKPLEFASSKIPENSLSATVESKHMRNDSESMQESIPSKSALNDDTRTGSAHSNRVFTRLAAVKSVDHETHPPAGAFTAEQKVKSHDELYKNSSAGGFGKSGYDDSDPVAAAPEITMSEAGETCDKFEVASHKPDFDGYDNEMLFMDAETKSNESLVRINEIINSYDLVVSEGRLDINVWVESGIISRKEAEILAPPAGKIWYVSRSGDGWAATLVSEKDL